MQGAVLRHVQPGTEPSGLIIHKSGIHGVGCVNQEHAPHIQSSLYSPLLVRVAPKCTKSHMAVCAAYTTQPGVFHNLHFLGQTSLTAPCSMLPCPPIPLWAILLLERCLSTFSGCSLHGASLRKGCAHQHVHLMLNPACTLTVLLSPMCGIYQPFLPACTY